MTFLNATLNSLEESRIYHEEQVRLLQEEIDQATLSASYGDDAVSSVKAAIENIDPKHSELLKEHLLSLFDSSDNEVFTSPEPAVFNPPQPDIPHTQDKNEQPNIVKLSDNDY